MRQLPSNISAISNLIANLGNQLIVRSEATRSRGTDSLFALLSGASHLIHEMRDALRHWPTLTWGVKVRVPAVSQRQHTDMCRRPVA
jgi:hypothetical protein